MSLYTAIRPHGHSRQGTLNHCLWPMHVLLCQSIFSLNAKFKRKVYLFTAVLHVAASIKPGIVFDILFKNKYHTQEISNNVANIGGHHRENLKIWCDLVAYGDI